MRFARRRLVASIGLAGLALTACGSGAFPLLDGARSIGSGSGSGGGAPPGEPARPPPPSANQKAVEELPVGQMKVLATLTGSGEAGDTFAAPSGVAVDPQGGVYVVDPGRKRVVTFDRDGKFKSTWTGSGGDVAFDVPIDVAVGPAGGVYVLDKGKGLVHAFNAAGQPVGQYGSDGPGFYNPYGIAGGADGYFVADTGTGRVVKYGPTGAKVAEFRGAEKGELREPTGVLGESDGGVLVVDGALGRLVRYSPDGKVASTTDVAVRGTARLARMPDGSVLISDPLRGRIIRWSADGKPVGRYGEPGAEEGKFNLPTGLAVDAGGGVYVADTQNNRVVKVQLL
jgi:sugar lactone lactonase YvrE